MDLHHVRCGEWGESFDDEALPPIDESRRLAWPFKECNRFSIRANTSRRTLTINAARESSNRFDSCEIVFSVCFGLTKREMSVVLPSRLMRDAMKLSSLM